MIQVERNTAETQIRLELDFSRKERSKIELPLPFLAHMLNAMAWHGGFTIDLKGDGDIDVDPHHLVEDTGIVLGTAFAKLLEESAVKRYGHSVIPMDDALGEAVVDACNRAYLVYQADYPQPYSGTFDMSLFKEFFSAFAANARINLHLIGRYGENSHHIIEALFKAMGRALKQAFEPVSGDKAAMSTKEAL